MAWSQIVISLTLISCSFAILSKRSYNEEQNNFRQFEYQTFQAATFPLAQLFSTVSNNLNGMGDRLTRTPEQFEHGGHHEHPGYGYYQPPGNRPPPPPHHHHHHYHNHPSSPFQAPFQPQFNVPGFPKLPDLPQLPSLPQLPTFPQQFPGFQQNFPKLPGFPASPGINKGQQGFPNNPFVNNMFGQRQPQQNPQQPQKPNQVNTQPPPQISPSNPTDDLISGVFGGHQGNNRPVTTTSKPIQTTVQPKTDDLIHSVFAGIKPTVTTSKPTIPPSPAPVTEESMDDLIQSIFSNMDDKTPNSGPTTPPSNNSELIYDIDVRSS